MLLRRHLEGRVPLRIRSHESLISNWLALARIGKVGFHRLGCLRGIVIALVSTQEHDTEDDEADKGSAADGAANYGANVVGGGRRCDGC